MRQGQQHNHRTSGRASAAAPSYRQALVALQQLEASGADYSYFVHADDDSLLRLDLLMPLLVSRTGGEWSPGPVRFTVDMQCSELPGGLPARSSSCRSALPATCHAVCN